MTSMLKEHTKKALKTLLRFAKSGDLYVFLLFFGISFAFWWSQSMSGTYELTIPIPVELVGESNDMRVTSGLSQNMRVLVSGKGSVLWKEQIRRRKAQPIFLDQNTFAARGGHASFATASLRDTLESIFSPSVTIREIYPDSLTFRYIHEKIVRVPVRFQGELNSINQFIPDKVVIVPESILAGIPNQMADSILTIPTKSQSIDVNADTVWATIELDTLPQVVAYQQEVKVMIVASQQTEKRIEVPVNSINVPHGIALKTFPSKVSVAFWVRMADFDAIQPENFRVVVDYNDITGNKSEKIQLRIFNQPVNVDRVRVIPGSVDYLIERTADYFITGQE